MKNILAMVLVILLSEVVADARIPSPVSAGFHITCTVAEKAEWLSGNRAAYQLPAIQNNDANLTLVANPYQAPSDSTVEIDGNGIFRNGSFPIDIITVTQPADHLKPASKTITACWKI